MSYELYDVTHECICPCGKGRIAYGRAMNDWNQYMDGKTEIWCSECSKTFRLEPDGLLPIDYPYYHGDEDARVKMEDLQHAIQNYRINYWDPEVKQKRWNAYLLLSEINETDECKKTYYFRVAFYFAYMLYKRYSLEVLQETLNKVKQSKSSKSLSGIPRDIAKSHQKRFKTIKLANICYAIEVAIRNYKLYEESDTEDNLVIEQLKQKYEQYKSIYYANFDEYQVKRRQHLITYELKRVKQ